MKYAYSEYHDWRNSTATANVCDGWSSGNLHNWSAEDVRLYENYPVLVAEYGIGVSNDGRICWMLPTGSFGVENEHSSRWFR
ncbi:MAG: hypothetical protein AABY88_07485 [Pseudomonadota bacterium]